MEKLNCLSCEIFIGIDFLSPSLILSRPSKDFFLITDSDVYSHHSSFINSLQIPFKVVKSGESSKTREVKQEVEDFLFTQGCSKKSTIVGFGGGMISDLVGFVASTFMRGIEIILIPTSLLSMADSTIGGKNAVDTSFGKNLIGSIYRPCLVFIDLKFLNTLPRLMWSAGMAEIIKIAAILDRDLYELLKEKSVGELVADLKLTKDIVKRAVELKAQVVEQDEFEAGLRMILNFGHTVGHAVEAELQDFNHGLCVGIGMYVEVEMASYLNKTEIDPEEFKEMLNQYELPWKVPDIPGHLLLAKAKLDKKRRSDSIPIFVPHKIGHIKPVAINVSDSDFLLLCSNSISVSGSPSSFEGVRIPGSKSLTNRYILLSALCKEPTFIKDPLVSEDTLVMIDCLTSMGLCTIEKKEGGLLVTGLEFSNKNSELYVSNAGTVARFLAMTCLLMKGNTVMRGSKRMHERPIKDLIDAINITGVRGKYLGNPGHLPIEIVGGGFQGGEVHIDGSISSQYVSSILMAAPFFENNTTVNLTRQDEPTSFSYIKMTVLAMQQFGASIQMLSPSKYLIENKGYKSPGTVTVEPDAGSASYLFAMAALHQTSIEVSGLTTSSMQGELEFVKVLSAMGCEVEISNNSTKITGRPLHPVSVDMNNCTDSFITASVLMACCEGASEIKGIANQRLKESNRILAVVTELGKLGIYAEETQDGLIIHGGGLKGHAEIFTYNDHRIAMGFSILSSVRPGINILDKHVVCKTFPSYWKTLNNCGFQLEPASRARTGKNLVIIGMRGVGKSTQGRTLAHELGWQCVDIDSMVQERLNVQSLAQWIEENGINEFRHLEYDELAKYINHENTVIVCGGGIVEYSKAIPLLYNHFPVVWIRSPKDIAKKNLEEESPHRFSINFDEAYQRRKPLYEKVSDFQFYFGVRDLEKTSQNFMMFVDKVLGQKSRNPPNFSAFGCVTESTEKGVIMDSKFLNALEVRSDCYKKMRKAYKDLSGMKDFIVGVQTIFTYRGDVDGKYWKVLKESLKFLPDFIDVQFENGAKWYLGYLDLKNCLHSTRIILSYHTESTEDVENIYKQMHLLKPDIVKFIAPYKPTVPSKSLEIVFALGIENSVTRLMNTFFSPVRVDVPMGRGQLSYQELCKYQEEFSIKSANLKIYLAGNNISRSPASHLYNNLFQEYGIKYTLEYLETESLEQVVQTLKDPSCMGMLITIPFKQTIIPYLDIITEEAQAMGSVNTITKYKSWLIGHNTDWVGLYYPIKSAIKGKSGLDSCKAAVLGAGGTSKAALFALEKLGIKNVTLWNRSNDRIAAGEWKCKTTNNLEDIKECGLIISTIPGSSQVKLEGLNGDSVVVEAAYFPDPTVVGKQAIDVGAKLITGKDMYLYMALHQFPLFTGRSITRSLIAKYLRFNS